MIRAAIMMVTFVLMVGGHVVAAQTAPQAEPSSPSGKEVFQRKCFQCHAGTMWTTLRGDRTMWLGVLYRMVGLRALWTEAEINAMADFLAQTRGPK